MTKRMPLSKAELEIAQVLWRLRTATVREVFDSLPEERRIDFWTVQTLLRRMEAKGYARSTLTGRVRTYRPRIRRQTVVRGIVDDFVHRVFGGQALPLFQQLIEDSRLSEDEIAQLRRMLDQRKG